MGGLVCTIHCVYYAQIEEFDQRRSVDRRTAGDLLNEISLTLIPGGLTRADTSVAVNVATVILRGSSVSLLVQPLFLYH
jgi:hypothetical protein